MILADFNGNGQIDSFNVQQLSRLALRLPVTGVAPLPSPAPTTTDTDRLTAEEPPKKETEEADPVPISDVDMPNRLSTMLRSRSFAFSNALPNSRLVPPGRANGERPIWF